MRIPDFLRVAVRCWTIILTLLVALVIAPSLATADAGYRINKGDKLKVDVWQEENLHAEVMVLPDGTISFPLVGVIQAAGKTTDELQIFLQQRLEEYIPGPEVNISLITVEGNQIFIIGEVARPGPYIMSKNLDVMQALSLAGGLTPFAAKNDIRILRRDNDGVSETLLFSYSDVADGDNLGTNILLQSGDTVIIP
ncbi:sugar transporter [Methylomonas lenta]|uniref:Sugar transporter n=1 Tax=Methylomonas lenta TaxID=980561 RepID=A0A177N279_9GAMM|nr:polysaccharide biosynthesis/export family protein [Methylomonas lenta]OAI11992.1 sugar transporter [Methylomonas lenta]